VRACEDIKNFNKEKDKKSEKEYLIYALYIFRNIRWNLKKSCNIISKEKLKTMPLKEFKYN
jgi:hypothetical protein